MRRVAKVNYHLSIHRGAIFIDCNQEDNDKVIISKAKKILQERLGGKISFDYQSFEVER